jgi:glycosyltransferase involved in cell wall biosynthesis
MNSVAIYKSDSVPEDPTVSFVIPTYKNNEYLTSAIDSIIYQKKIESVSYEIVVISNNTEIDFEPFIAKYKDSPITFYKNEKNYGQVGNINQGAMLSKGRYISYLHDDDLLLPNYLAVVEKYVNNRKEYDCILPSYYLLGENFGVDYVHRFLDIAFGYRYLYRKELTEVCLDTFINSVDDIYGSPSCGALFYKKTLEDYGYFKDLRGAAWDFYNFREFNKQYKIYILHKYVGIRRSDSGMSKDRKVKEEFFEDWNILLEEELKDNNFIQKYKDAYLYKRPYLKYIFLKIRKNIYFYNHNLDKEVGINKRLYQEYTRGESR